jgi:hypothetical protein
MQMRANRLGITRFLVALLLVGVIGCGKETVDSAPPVASALAPSPGANNVAVNGSVTATFSETMNPATISTSTFTLTGATRRLDRLLPSPPARISPTTRSTPPQSPPEPQTRSALIRRKTIRGHLLHLLHRQSWFLQFHSEELSVYL